MHPIYPDEPGAKPQIRPGQTFMFLGDHTSPDEPGYLRVAGDVLARFHPELKLNLISAGAKGQTAAALASRQLLDLLTTSRPDWLVVGIGLTDAIREPDLSDQLREYGARMAAQRDELEAIGPEYRVNPQDLGPVSDIGREPELSLQRLGTFVAKYHEALGALHRASVQTILLTTILVGSDVRNPLNLVLRLYNRAIRDIAKERESILVDVERAFMDVLERATTYKQKVALAGAQGKVNAQGETLIARTFLKAVGLLPYPGFRAERQ